MGWSYVNDSAGDNVTPARSLPLAGKNKRVHAVPVYDRELEILPKRRVCYRIPHPGRVMKVEARRFDLNHFFERLRNDLIVAPTAGMPDCTLSIRHGFDADQRCPAMPVLG